MPDFYPHQLVGGDWLAARPRAGLFDQMGLGKTITAIRGAQVASIPRVLVVAPSIVLWNWRREWETWDPGCRVQIIATSKDVIAPFSDGCREVVITTHGMLLRPAVFDDQLLRTRWPLTILDEAHFFRSETAKRSNAFYRLTELREDDEDSSLVSRSDRVWILTGTPMANDASELWTHFRGLWPERIKGKTGKPWSCSTFTRRFCHLRHNGFGWKVAGNRRERLPELREKLADVTLRRKKSEVLKDLPSIRYEQITVRPSRFVWEIDSITKHVGPKIEETLRAGRDDLTFEQSFHALGDREEFARFRRLCALAKVDSVAELLSMELESGLEKVVVFGHHTEAIDMLHAAMVKFGSIKITGATPAKLRSTLVDRFQRDPATRVACCQIVAAGTGSTMTAASEVVFLEMSFVPGENAQAADRVHRISQTNDVRVRFVALDGTLDDAITTTLRRKTAMIREVLE